jgi:hypothetical protein
VGKEEEVMENGRIMGGGGGGHGKWIKVEEWMEKGGKVKDAFEEGGEMEGYIKNRGNIERKARRNIDGNEFKTKRRKE